MPVVISHGLVLAALVEGGPNAPLIGWHNLVTASGIVADEEDANYPATNLGNPSTALRWEAETTADQYINFSVSSLESIDYVGIARHNLGTGQTTVSVEALNEDEEWYEIADEMIPAGDQPIVLHFEAIQTSEIRIKLQPVALIPRIAVVYIGKLLRLQRGLQPGLVPLTWAASDDIIDAQSEAGDYLGAMVMRQSLATSVSVQWLDYSWWNENMPGFIAHARQRKPFFFAWLPASYPNEVGYAWTQSDIRPEAHNVLQGVAVHFDMSLRAVAL